MDEPREGRMLGTEQLVHDGLAHPEPVIAVGQDDDSSTMRA